MRRAWMICFVFAATVAMFGCGGSSGGGGGGGIVFNMNGGAGIAGNGGDGGYIDLYCDGRMGVEMVAGGSVNTSFTVPRDAKPILGSNAVIITADTTVDVYVDAAAAAADATLLDGELYMVLNNSNLYLRDSGGDTVVTGLQVNAGKTLTLGLNRNWGGLTGEDSCFLYLSDDIVISGTVKVKALTTGTVSGGEVELRAGVTATARDMGYLDLESNYSIFITATGKIDTAGVDATVANDRGGYGGGVYVYSSNGGLYLHGTIDASGGDGDGTGDGGEGGWYHTWQDGIYCETNDGYLISTGTMDCSGGDGAIGADAGYIELSSYSFVYSTGTTTLKSNGGEGTTGNGGDGDYVQLTAYDSSVYNKAKIECNGGDGAVDGGDAGSIYMYGTNNGNIGDVYSAGPLYADGGDGGTGNGGDGGYLYFETDGGDIRIAGSPVSMSAKGGNATAAGMSGGNAGYVEMYMYEGYDYANGLYVSPGDILVSGSILLTGGDGDTGGAGGYLYIQNTDDDYSYYNPLYKVSFVGYGKITADGGEGASGGDGGDIYIEQNYSDFPCCYYTMGPADVSSNFSAVGGEGITGNGGQGGYFYIDCEDGYPGYEDTALMDITGTFDLDGGDGVTGGGRSGYVEVYATNDLTFSGTINCSGGDGTGTNAGGGDADNSTTYFYGSDNVKISGVLNYKGGKATGTGSAGSGGDVEVYAGLKVTSNATYNMQGGDGDDTVGFGGDGGDLEFFSGVSGSSVSTSWNVDEGKANTDGSHGQVEIDWTVVER